MVGYNKKCLIVIILALLAVMVAAIGDAHQTPPPYPVREEAVIHNGDRLMASWLEGMFGVLYNWTQKAHLILSDMLYNGNGVASITADLITAKNKLVTPLVDATNITLSGTVRASAIQSGIVRTDDTITTRLTASSASVLGTLEASNISAGSLNTQNFDTLRLKTDTLLFDKSTTAPSLTGADSAIYYDATLDRYRMFTGGQWRDLTSQVTISSTTIGAPLKVEGWVEADNVKSLGKVEAQHLKGLDIELGYDGILSSGSEDIASRSIATINLGTIPEIRNTFSRQATTTRDITIEREKFSEGPLFGTSQKININTTTSVGEPPQVRKANIGSIVYNNTQATPTLNLSTNLSAKHVSLESLSVNTNINAANSSLNDLNVSQKLKIPVYSSSSSIASPTKGNLYFNSSSNKLNAYNGSDWEEVGTGEWTASSTTGDKIFNNGTISFGNNANFVLPASQSSPVNYSLRLNGDKIQYYDAVARSWSSTNPQWGTFTAFYSKLWSPYSLGEMMDYDGYSVIGYDYPPLVEPREDDAFYLQGRVDIGTTGNFEYHSNGDDYSIYDSIRRLLRGSEWYPSPSPSEEPTLLVVEADRDTSDNLRISGNITTSALNHIRIDSNHNIVADTVLDHNGGLHAPYGFIVPSVASATQATNSLRVNNGELQLYYGGWKNVSTPAQTVDTAMSDTSTNAVQNKVIKTYVDRKTAGISSETANINHANIIDLNGGDIDATNVAVTTKLKIPTSKTSYPTTGSICFNAVSDTLNVYDNGSWISFGSNVTISTAPVTVYFGDGHGHETTVTINTKIIEIGEHIVIWQLYGRPYFSSDYEINGVRISMPDQISGCETRISSEGQVDYNISGGRGFDKITTVAEYDSPQYYFITVKKDSVDLSVSSTAHLPLSFVDNFTVPDMFVVGFK